MLGSTLERVKLPDDLVARLEGKSSLGRLGLLIHSTAGFIDPGWDGHVTLELSNVANLPITIYRGMKIGQLSFVQLTEPAETPVRRGRPRLEVPGPAGADAEPVLEEFRASEGARHRGHGVRRPEDRNALVDAGHWVRVLERKPGAWKQAGLRCQEAVEGDVTDADSLRRAAAGCDAVVHLVAIINGSPRDFERVMEEGTRNVIAAAKEAGVRRFVLMSALGHERGDEGPRPLLPREMDDGAGRQGLGPRARDLPAELRLRPATAARSSSSAGLRGSRR